MHLPLTQRTRVPSRSAIGAGVCVEPFANPMLRTTFNAASASFQSTKLSAGIFASVRWYGFFLLEETLNLDYKLRRGTSAKVFAIKFDPREFADTQFSNDPLAPPYTLRYCPLYLRMRSEDGVLFTLRPKTYGFSHSFTFAGYRVKVDDIKRTQFFEYYFQ